jgi:hypothetical protein
MLVLLDRRLDVQSQIDWSHAWSIDAPAMFCAALTNDRTSAIPDVGERRELCQQCYGFPHSLADELDLVWLEPALPDHGIAR